MDNKFAWSVETVADYGYPMKIKSGAFYDEDGKVIAGIPADMYLSQQWWSGNSGSIIAGEQYKSIPKKMDIRWFSYSEDKFYSGTFNLDSEKLKSIFSKGLDCGDVKINSSYLKIALAPGGQLFLYLTSPNTELFGVYQAQEFTVIDFKKEMGYTIDETRMESFDAYVKKMPIQTQQEIANKNISMNIWKDISLRYPWKYTVEAKGWKSNFLSMQDENRGAEFVSGEDAWCRDTDYFTKATPKPVPTEIDGVFKTSAGRTFTIRIYPGNVDGLEPNKQTYEVQRAREQELVKLFKDFYKKTNNQEFEIHLKMDEYFKNGKVFLKKGTLEQEIPNTEVQIFDDTFGDE